MRIVAAGGTGFIGRALTAALARKGYEVVVLTRGRERIEDNIRFVHWEPRLADGTEAAQGNPGALRSVVDAVNGAAAVVNLAGTSIARRWTARNKRLIVDSRVAATRTLAEAIRNADDPPEVLVNASAVGYYGSCGDEAVTERSPSGDDFLAEVCRRWEQEALQVTEMGVPAAHDGPPETGVRADGPSGAARLELGRPFPAIEAERETADPSKPDGDARGRETPGEKAVRVVLARIGLVLGDGGALRLMALPFRLFVGGPLGSGRQWMPWIHLDDVVGMLRFAIRNKTVEGPLNVVGPQPLRNKEFANVLGRVLRRPSFMPTPAFAMRLVLGEMSDMVLSGQRAIPQKATAAGYRFQHVDAEAALRDVFRR